MFSFNTNRLSSGRKEVEDIIEIAETLGVGIIKVTGKAPGASPKGIANFEIGKWGYDPRGRLSGGTTTFGYLYLYPDKHRQLWGFVLDTPHNRNVLAGHISAPVIDIADKAIKAELIAYCDEHGINVVPEAGANPYIKKSINETRLEEKAKRLEADLRKLELEKNKLLSSKEDAEKALARKAQYHANNSDVTVTELQYDEKTDSPVNVEVPASLPVEKVKVEKKTPTSKVDKPLAKKKITKK